MTLGSLLAEQLPPGKVGHEEVTHVEDADDDAHGPHGQARVNVPEKQQMQFSVSRIYNVQCPLSPVVLPLSERGGAGHLGPGLPLPGHDGHHPASHEHEGADKIPNWLKQIKGSSHLLRISQNLTSRILS